jgi:A/G-specific adenine glycosylase
MLKVKTKFIILIFYLIFYRKLNFSEEIIQWYQANKRELPWRSTKNPYFIWISEIILQQTRVAQGLPYYYKFIKKFPTIKHLANAGEDEVLKTWQGLGYYSRARNLHHTAKTIAENNDSVFPYTYEELVKLKGIGHYTAAAIASFAFDLPHPAIDGNVHRLLSRYFGIEKTLSSASEKKFFYDLALGLMKDYKPEIFNQAMIEFGSQMCSPQNPNCLSCPLSDFCVAFIEDKIQHLPLKKKKTVQRIRYFNYLLIEDGSNIIITKRTRKDIWRNLYEFPLLETSQASNIDYVLNEIRINKILRGRIVIKNVSEEYVHQLTHQKLVVKFFRLKSKYNKGNNAFIRISKEDFSLYAVPRIIEKYLSKNPLS